MKCMGRIEAFEVKRNEKRARQQKKIVTEEGRKKLAVRFDRNHNQHTTFTSPKHPHTVGKFSLVTRVQVGKC